MNTRLIENQPIISDDKCERLVLGTILQNKGLADNALQRLNENCFYNPKNKEIWKSIHSLMLQGRVPDIVNVYSDIASRGIQFVAAFDVAELTSEESFYNFDEHVLRLINLAKRRNLWKIGQELVSAGIDEATDITELQQYALNGLEETIGTNGIYDLSDAIKSLMDTVSRNMSGQGLTGAPTGFKHWDKKGGLQKSDLIIVAGESSQGKTSFALSVISSVLQSGGKVAFYSMEMTKEQLAARMIATQSSVSASRILYERISPEELLLLDKAVGLMDTERLFFDDNSTSDIESILISIRAMKMRYDIDGVVIDYLQILNVNNRSSQTREQAMGDVSRRLKNIAKELDIWVIALSQLSRNSQTPEPSLNRLRDSGQIAEASDIVLLVYRPEIYNKPFPPPYEDEDTRGRGMIDVAKGRNIGTFKFLVEFDAKTTKFSDATLDDIPISIEEIRQDEEDAPF